MYFDIFSLNLMDSYFILNLKRNKKETEVCIIYRSGLQWVQKEYLSLVTLWYLSKKNEERLIIGKVILFTKCIDTTIEPLLVHNMQ